MRDSLAGADVSLAAWRRIESEKPSGYWEENVVEGRRLARERVAKALSPLRGLRVVDLGCGAGLLSTRLRREGARVVGVDCRADWMKRSVEGGAFALADIRAPIVGHRSFDAAVLQEVVEECSPSERSQLLGALADWHLPRVIVVARCTTRWSRLQDHLEGRGRLSVVDPIELLRKVHLETPFRLVGREEVRRRNYRALVAEFHHVHDEREV